jgi:hypothetical protein
LKADYLKLRAQGEPLHAYPELIEMIDQELALYTQDDPQEADLVPEVEPVVDPGEQEEVDVVPEITPA